MVDILVWFFGILFVYSLVGNHLQGNNFIYEKE